MVGPSFEADLAAAVDRGRKEVELPVVDSQAQAYSVAHNHD